MSSASIRILAVPLAITRVSSRLRPPLTSQDARRGNQWIIRPDGFSDLSYQFQRKAQTVFQCPARSGRYVFWCGPTAMRPENNRWSDAKPHRVKNRRQPQS